MSVRRYEIVCVIVTMLALAVGAANKWRLVSPPDAAPFLKDVREMSTTVLGQVPGMVVTNGRVPKQAFEILHPNVLEARNYTDLATGYSFSVLLVHCSDINDMGAHYPPVCYPGSGYKVTQTDPMPIQLGRTLLDGVEYELVPPRSDERIPIRIWNCMFLSGGTTTYLPSVLRQRSRTGNLRYYGSGQIQVLVPASIPESQRVAMYRQALTIYEPVISQMLKTPPALQATSNLKYLP